MPNHDRFECQTAIDSDAILHADGSVPLKLSGKIHKQLESIARSRGVLPKKLLNEMIEQAYHDLVATRQNSQIDSR